MSRGILYASLAVLVALLSGISFMLRKETDPPPPPTPQQNQAMQAAQRQGEKQNMMAQMKAQHEKMAAMLRAKSKPAANGKGAKPARATGMQITNKWFEVDKPGKEGIEHPADLTGVVEVPGSSASKSTQRSLILPAAKSAISLPLAK